jgi:hypothetical protein
VVAGQKAAFADRGATSSEHEVTSPAQLCCSIDHLHARQHNIQSSHLILTVMHWLWVVVGSVKGLWVGQTAHKRCVMATAGRTHIPIYAYCQQQESDTAGPITE